MQDDVQFQATTEQLAEEIFYYYKLRRPLNCSYQRLSKVLKDVLNAAALCCKQEGVNAAMYVAAHFHLKNPDTVYLKMLYQKNGKSEALCREFKKAHQVDTAALYEHYLKKLSTQINLGRSVEWILMNDDFNFPPWFRICITKEPIPEVMEKYLYDAKQEMNPPLRAFIISKNLDVSRISKA